MYILVREDLSLPQKIVQSAHAAIESAKSFLGNELEHPHLVVLATKNEKTLYKSAQKLDQLGIRYRIFIEPDIGNEATALATEVVRGDNRRIFKNYQCIKERNYENNNIQ